jgi:hypothetical protein
MAVSWTILDAVIPGWLPGVAGGILSADLMILIAWWRALAKPQLAAFLQRWRRWAWVLIVGNIALLGMLYWVPRQVVNTPPARSQRAPIPLVEPPPPMPKTSI